jgi:hypothetical protein
MQEAEGSETVGTRLPDPQEDVTEVEAARAAGLARDLAARQALAVGEASRGVFPDPHGREVLNREICRQEPRQE